MAQQPRLRLRDGNTIPQIGLGLWQVDSGLTARVVSEGIKAGYRLIDTAEGYNNEEGVGQAIREAEVPRSELFITSKLRNGGHARNLALRSFDETMRAATPTRKPSSNTWSVLAVRSCGSRAGW